MNICMDIISYEVLTVLTDFQYANKSEVIFFPRSLIVTIFTYTIIENDVSSAIAYHHRGKPNLKLKA